MKSCDALALGEGALLSCVWADGACCVWSFFLPSLADGWDIKVPGGEKSEADKHLAHPSRQATANVCVTVDVLANMCVTVDVLTFH